MAEMTKRERLMASVKGNPVDRVPASYYFHYHPAERSAKSNVQHLLEQQRKFDWDFIKVQLGAHYYGQGWGCTYKEDPLWGPQIDKHIIYEAKDYRKLEKLDITQGPFGEQLRVAQMLNETLKGSIPFIQTTFSPLSVAGRMAGATGCHGSRSRGFGRRPSRDSRFNGGGTVERFLQAGARCAAQTLEASFSKKRANRGGGSQWY